MKEIVSRTTHSHIGAKIAGKRSRATFACLLVFLFCTVLALVPVWIKCILPYLSGISSVTSRVNDDAVRTVGYAGAVSGAPASEFQFISSSFNGNSQTEPVAPYPELHLRSGIFPPEAEREKFYCGRWHDFSQYVGKEVMLARNELCKISGQTNKAHPHTVMDKVQALQKADLESCKDKHPYCRDSLDLFKAGLSDIVLIHFGDKPDDVENLPFFSKMRDATRRRGIIWPLNVQRHFGTMAQVDTGDRDWEEKKEKIVWRGADTGYDGERERIVKLMFAHTSNEVDIAFGPVLLNPEMKKFSRGGLSPDQMMRNKYLLSLDGNDVASGLKWMLYSNSVVFMPHTRFETWGMESFLKPYTHYIPLYRNLSNLSQQLVWAKQNDELCKNISNRATMFMKNFREYATAEKQNAEIEAELKEKLVRTYERVISQVFADNFTLSECS